jgi:hypothetical protein
MGNKQTNKSSSTIGLQDENRFPNHSSVKELGIPAKDLQVGTNYVMKIKIKNEYKNKIVIGKLNEKNENQLFFTTLTGLPFNPMINPDPKFTIEYFPEKNNTFLGGKKKQQKKKNKKCKTKRNK